MNFIRTRSRAWALAALALAVALPMPALGQPPKEGGPPSPPAPSYPPFDKTIEGFEKVVSTVDGQPSMYTLYIRKSDSQILAALPRDFANKKYFFALTVASGQQFAGLQGGDLYVYWKQYDKRLALIAPNTAIRSTGDAESKASVARLYTDQVLTDVPIVTMGQGPMGPVIDLDQFLLSNSGKFFGTQITNPNLVTIKTIKAFPNNIEIGLEGPTAGGRLQTLHYSISLIPENTGYTPRKADERIGYFTTNYSDFGLYKTDTVRVRHINRWKLEKADASLKVSPPKNPIVYYIEHTTPIRYRRWVREGVLAWNKAFEKVGISNAIEVYYQDASTGAHMEKDPEDVRYNFVRWLNNNVGTAIGPSRAHPITGEILDADIVLTDGWIRSFRVSFNDVLPQIALEGFSPETLSWLDSRPNWDPRYLMAPAAQRDSILAERARRGARSYGGHPLAAQGQRERAQLDGHADDGDEVVFPVRRHNHELCMAAFGKSLDVAMMRMHFETLGDEPKKDDDKDKEKDKDKKKAEEEKKKKEEFLLDGMPEEFIGPLLMDLVAHEVGHTLGLRHNFKASSVYDLSAINSKAFKGVKALTGSVMDYNPVNMNLESGEVQGDYTMIGVGPYDMWAIEYGYSFESDLKPILNRVADPELQFATDEDTFGPDPLARRYDFGKNPLDYAETQIRLAKYHRSRLIEKFVKDGESWAKARKGYEMTLSFQTKSLSMMANWIGGAHIHRDKKGDKNARLPIVPVPAETQRKALAFVIRNAFQDDSFGINSDLLNRLTDDRWLDDEDFVSIMNAEAAWPIHDRIMGIQGSTLTMIMNPNTLRRVYDNELRVAADQDAVTLPELLSTVREAIWSELDKAPQQPCTPRKPAISSLRRNLQREHLARLIDLSLPGAGSTAAYKPISNLAVESLKTIKGKIAEALKAGQGKFDPYTQAHLSEAHDRIGKALDAEVIYNARDIGGFGGIPSFIFGERPAAGQGLNPRP